MVLGESNFLFRFRLFIQFLPLWSMDEKVEAEPNTAVAKYYQRSIPVFCKRGFHKLDEIANTVNIGIREFTMWKQKIQWKMLTPVGIEPRPLIPSPTLSFLD